MRGIALAILASLALAAVEASKPQSSYGVAADWIEGDPDEMPLATPLKPAKPTLPVICYHRFGPGEEKDTLRISAKRLGDQLHWLKSNGYQSVSLNQAEAFLRGAHEGLPAKPVILSIDDGYRNGWTVGKPLFEKYGFKAVYFVTTDQIGVNKNWLSWQDLRDILAAGHEVGSHTVKHSNLAWPRRSESAEAYRERVESELRKSKQRLESHLGISMTALAYPFGAYNEYVETRARAAGYQLMFSVSGDSNALGAPLGRLRRLLIIKAPRLASFARQVAAQPSGISLQGLEEGQGFYRRAFPLSVTLNASPQWNGQEPKAEWKGAFLPMTRLVTADGASWVTVIPKGQVPGIYAFKVQVGEGKEAKREAYVCQIYRSGWKSYFLNREDSLDPKP